MAAEKGSGVVTLELKIAVVGERGEMPDTGQGVEVVGNDEDSLAGDKGGGGGLVRAGLDGRGGTSDGIFGTWVMTFGKLVPSGGSFAGLVLASDLGPMEKLEDPVVVPIIFIEVDSSLKMSTVKIIRNLERSKAPGWRAVWEYEITIRGRKALE